MAVSPSYDYAVIGAGIAGASLAYRLSVAGARVLVLEQEAQPGYHATGRSAAMFMESYGTEQIRALTQASQPFYLQPPDGFTTQPILIPRGALYVARPGQEQLLETAYAAYRRQGLAVQRLTPDAAIAMVPCLARESLADALLDTEASDIDVHELHQGFLRGARAGGAEFLYDARLASASPGPGGWSMRTEAGRTLHAHALVNAAGAWADAVAERCGGQALGIQPMRRSAFLFDPPAGMDTGRWPCVIGIDESFYFKPDAGLLLGSPANADPVPAQDVAPEEIDIATGIFRIEEVSSLRIRRPRHTWAGLRSFAPDHEFVIGWDPRLPQFFWLAGQGGYGIQTAAGASELAAGLLLGRELSATLARFGVSSAAVDPARLTPVRTRGA